jgi:hypothetical protein
LLPEDARPLWLGHSRLNANRNELADINLLVFTLFGPAMFDGVVLRFFAEPIELLGLSAVASIVALGSIGIAMIALRAMGADVIVSTMHLSATATAEALNRRGITTASGKRWQAIQIIRARQRLDLR